MSNMSDDDIFEGFEDETLSEPEEPTERSGNRNVLVIVGVIGGFFVLALIVLGVVAALFLPSRNAARQQQAAEINAANTATVLAATQMAFAQQLQEPTQTPIPSATSQPSPTAVIVQATATSVIEAAAQAEETTTPDGAMPKDLLSRTQTVAVLLTQAAQGFPTAAAGAGATSTALPTTGFADEVGLPVLAGLAAVLVGVIFFVRRLRTSA